MSSHATRPSYGDHTAMEIDITVSVEFSSLIKSPGCEYWILVLLKLFLLPFTGTFYSGLEIICHYQKQHWRLHEQDWDQQNFHSLRIPRTH